MPTDSLQRPAVFLFAHQDDEFGVYPRLEQCRLEGQRVLCVYFTDGVAGNATSAQRNAESLAVLAELGVAPGDVVFAGEQLGIGDARLPQHLAAAEAWLGAWLDSIGPVGQLYLPAWEGGHHDHDALHALGATLAQRRGLLADTVQYALYNGARIPHPFFRIMSPLPENGPVQQSRIALGLRLRCLRWCLSYPSQRKTWIGLFPFALWKFLFVGKQGLQQVSLERVGQRPHAGALYYEQRGFFTWQAMQESLQAWRRQ